MLDERSFLQAINADPDDDGPRLLFADFLDEKGDPASAARAEFIRMQCALEAMNADDPARTSLRSREIELLEANWRTWIRPACQALGEPVPRNPGRHLGMQAERYGIRWLDASCRRSHAIEQAASDDGNTPYFHSCQFHRGMLGYVALGSKPYRSELNVVRLWDRESIDGLMLASFEPREILKTLEAIEADRLRSLELHFTGEEALHFISQIPRLTKLRHLVLRGVYGRTDVGRMLAERTAYDLLRTLETYSCTIDDKGLQVISRGRFAERLERLVIVNCGLTDESAALLGDNPMRFPNLRYVDFTENNLTGRGIEALRQRFGNGAVTETSEHPWPSQFFE